MGEEIVCGSMKILLIVQGERRFFRVCFKWLAEQYRAEASHLIPFVATYGRYDDLFVLEGTPCEEEMFRYLHNIIQQDDDYLIFKWLKSENCSSFESKRFARKTREAFHMTPREYRKMLSEGRKYCHLVETLMSQNRWNEIAFQHLPSKAGLMYKNAFMRREETKYRYAEFMANKNTKVNAGVLTPVDIAHQIFNTYQPSSTERQAWDKYWENLPDYYNGKEEPGIAIVDVSGSMYGTPIEAAISLGAYIAERGKGPFKNHFITFSDCPELVNFVGTDLYDKFKRAENADWGGSTNIEAVFDLLLNTAINNNVPASEMPKTLYIFSDMEFNFAITTGKRSRISEDVVETVIEAQASKWRRCGYEIPRVIFWNLDARHNNIPAMGSKFSYVSGFSPNMVECILGGKNGWDLCLEKLQSDRYKVISSINIF